MRRVSLWLIVLLILTVFWLTLPEKIDDNWASGEVVRVIDGDSIVIQQAEMQVEIRLIGIDAPEFGQPYFVAAKEFLSSHVSPGSSIYYTQEIPQKDVYDRLLVHAFTSPNLPFDESLNLKLVAAGLAIVPDYPDKSIYYDKLKWWQDYAQKNKLGVHSDT